ncbi:hypothetical protein UFOVP1290_143 [uncultured Caudovirales phage]|uniref:Uncharacterized protein n=1 Tax=uncultured Caudovirales phage TaxID=2100421 RepID=A0A6J5RGZ6_9CAUD|nr:hypothetical protein UFOVP1290_143 [uncultured Caudovirales phage]
MPLKFLEREREAALPGASQSLDLAPLRGDGRDERRQGFDELLCRSEIEVQNVAADANRLDLADLAGRRIGVGGDVLRHPLDTSRPLHVEKCRVSEPDLREGFPLGFVSRPCRTKLRSFRFVACGECAEAIQLALVASLSLVQAIPLFLSGAEPPLEILHVVLQSFDLRILLRRCDGERSGLLREEPQNLVQAHGPFSLVSIGKRRYRMGPFYLIRMTWHGN